ncbi:hypothetical protein Tco_0590462 [Tanacetum coccineum]
MQYGRWYITDPSSLTALGGRKDPGLQNITSTSFSALKVYANHEAFKEIKLELLNASFDCKDFLEREVIMLFRCFKRATLDFFSAKAGFFSGGIFSARHLIAFTTLVCLGIHYGGFLFNMGNNKAV